MQKCLHNFIFCQLDYVLTVYPICWLLGSDLSSHWTTVLEFCEVLSPREHALRICSRGVTADTSTVPAHFSSAPLPPQGLGILCTIVRGPISMATLIILLWGSDPSLSLLLDLGGSKSL